MASFGAPGGCAQQGRVRQAETGHSTQRAKPWVAKLGVAIVPERQWGLGKDLLRYVYRSGRGCLLSGNTFDTFRAPT